MTKYKYHVCAYIEGIVTADSPEEVAAIIAPMVKTFQRGTAHPLNVEITEMLGAKSSTE